MLVLACDEMWKGRSRFRDTAEIRGKKARPSGGDAVGKQFGIWVDRGVVYVACSHTIDVVVVVGIGPLDIYTVHASRVESSGSRACTSHFSCIS